MHSTVIFSSLWSTLICLLLPPCTVVTAEFSAGAKHAGFGRSDPLKEPQPQVNTPSIALKLFCLTLSASRPPCPREGAD